MRRRRQRLQVSTFPFLAVLLCAMGSLILLLLVIDRRAKAVARAKALQALTKKDEEALRAAEAHRAEWERRRQELHAHLAQEDQEVTEQIKGLESKITAAQGEYQSEKERLLDLQRRLQTESKRLLADQTQEAKAQQTEEEQKKQIRTSQAELARLATELDQLEQTLADLKAFRRRQAQTYSLVPYKGKRGENRRPLYVECTPSGLIFHPDRLTLEGISLSPSTIRTEVQRRILRQQAEMKVGGKKEEQKPYLLMLVRPAGITNYYRTQAALAGLKVDFGYEFIEADWALDFSAEGGPQPWMAASPTVPGPKDVASVRKSPARKTTVAGMGSLKGFQGVNFGGGTAEGPLPPNVAPQDHPVLRVSCRRTFPQGLLAAERATGRLVPVGLVPGVHPLGIPGIRTKKEKMAQEGVVFVHLLWFRSRTFPDCSGRSPAVQGSSLG
jgi:hypothetical protein